MREIDFLRGRPAANLACFALPALGANLLQSADQVMDMLVVGAFVGERGLAALAHATMVGFVERSCPLPPPVAPPLRGLKGPRGTPHKSSAALPIGGGCRAAPLTPLRCGAALRGAKPRRPQAPPKALPAGAR